VKPTKLFIVPFTVRETIGGLKHLSYLFRRILFRQPIDKHLKSQVDSGLAQPVLDQGGKLRVCWTCGFALARITLADDWALETCSASGLKHVLQNSRLEEWSKSLPKSVSSVGTLPSSKV
jgi:hypothetical protein